MVCGQHFFPLGKYHRQVRSRRVFTLATLYTRLTNHRRPYDNCYSTGVRLDSSHLDPRDLGLICLEKKRKIRFRILSDLKIQSWIFLKKRTPWIYSGSRFFGSFDVPWSERSWIDLFSKETQNPFSDSFGFKNQSWIFLKKRLHFMGCSCSMKIVSRIPRARSSFRART